MNPTELEVVGDGQDPDCDDRDALRRFLGVGFFSAGTWTTTGTVTFPAGNLRVGDAAAGDSSAKRTFNLLRTTGYSGVMVDIEAAGGPACAVTLHTGPAGSPGSTPNPGTLPSGADTAWIPIGEIAVPHVLKSISVDCPATGFVLLDWFVVQNADLAFPPGPELSIDWHDTRTPGGGWTTTVVRTDETAYGYMGSDVAGVARWDATTLGWRTAFGTGEATLATGGTMAVADILAEAGGSALYVLTGDAQRGEDNVGGGLWYSGDRGNNWSVVADSFSADWDHDGIPGPDYPPEDDVAGLSFLSQCPESEESTATEWIASGGRLLQGDWFVAGEVIYVGNADPEALGVSVYDGATGETCPLAHTGDLLPAQPVSAVLRVDVQPTGDPALVVGYAARQDGGPGLYACELPSGGMDCSGATSAACQAVSGSEGIDVRDLQRDLRFLDTTVYVADASYLPLDTDADGLYEPCTVVDPGIDALVLDDTAGLAYTYDRVATVAELPSIGARQLTGVGMDQGGGYLFANAGAAGSDFYAIDRMYRVALEDLGLGIPWTPVNDEDGVTTSIHDLDAREGVRQGNSDVTASWLGQSIVGVPDVFPARSAPGTGIDTTWIEPGFPVVGGLAVVSTKFNSWLVSGLDATWTDGGGLPGIDSEEETAWLFWPGVDPAERGTYQTMQVLEVAVTPAGEIFQSLGDHGLAYLDPATYPQSSASPNSSEVDCLWNDGFTGGGAGVDVGLDGSVWVALRDQSVSFADPYPHAGGVLRYADLGLGWAWSFAAGAYLDGAGKPVFNMDDVVPQQRLCLDLESTTNSIEAMDTLKPSPFAWDLDHVADPSFGNPATVRPLDATTAVVLFRPTSVTDGTSTVTTTGGLYATLSGGVSYADVGGTEAWLPVPFDGSYTVGTTTGTCDETAAYEHGHVQHVHPGVDSYAYDLDLDGVVDDADLDGYPDDFLLDLLYVVSANDTTYVDDGSGTDWSPCAVARVLVGPDGTGGLDATWEWIPLRKDYEPYDAGECGIDGRNVAGASVAPWAGEAYIFGSYYRDPRTSSGAYRRGGGACVLELATGATTVLVDPAEHEYNVADVVPHPQVSDLLAILPQLSRETWLQCGHDRLGSEAYGSTCSYPWPMLAERQASTWNLVELSSMPPTGIPVDGAWSEPGLAVGDDVESWLVVGTAGAGSWRGVLEW